MQDLTYGITLDTELVHLGIRAEDYHNAELGYAGKGHLNIRLALNANRNSAPPLHGILGQTVDASLVAEQQVMHQLLF